MAEYFGKGTVLEVDTTGAGAWATIIEAKSIGGPSFEAEEVDVTTHDDAGSFRTYIRGLIDPGEITAEVNWDPLDASHQRLFSDLGDGTERPYRIRWANMSPATNYKLDFNAFVRSLPISSPVDNVMTANLTLRVTGAVAMAAV